MVLLPNTEFSKDCWLINVRVLRNDKFRQHLQKMSVKRIWTTLCHLGTNRLNGLKGRQRGESVSSSATGIWSITEYGYSKIFVWDYVRTAATVTYRHTRRFAEFWRPDSEHTRGIDELSEQQFVTNAGGDGAESVGQAEIIWSRCEGIILRPQLWG